MPDYRPKDKENYRLHEVFQDEDIYEQLKKPRGGKSVGPNTYYVIQMVDAGFSVREIATDLGISTQRVYQILWREGKQPPSGKQKKKTSKRKPGDAPPQPVRHDPDDEAHKG